MPGATTASAQRCWHQVRGLFLFAAAYSRSTRQPDVFAASSANQADTSMTLLVGGEAQGSGVRFANDIASTDQQAVNLDAVLGALPKSPGARATIEDLFQTLRATGTQKQQGSPTDFNAQYRAEIGGETLPQQDMIALKTGGRSPLLANLGDVSRRAYLGRTTCSWPRRSRPRTAWGAFARSSRGVVRHHTTTP